MREVDVRPLSVADAEQLGVLFESLATDSTAAHFHPHPLTPEFAYELCADIAVKKDRYFVATDGIALFGYAMLRGWDEGYTVPSFGVAVAAEARGRGVGRALLKYAIMVAADAGAASVILKVHPENQTARRLYESEGFVFEGVAQDGVQLLGRFTIPGPDASEPQAAGTPGLAWRTLKNSVWSILEFGWPVLVSLVATPYIVRELGADAYGVLSIVAVTVGFFGVLDLGVGGAALRAIAQEHERGNQPRINHILGTVILFYLAVGAVGAACIALATPWLVTSVLEIPPALQSEARVAFYLAALGFFVSLMAGAFGAVPRAIQRFDIATKLSVAFGTISTLLIVLLLAAGARLSGVVAVQVSVNLLSAVAYYFVARRCLPGLRVLPRLDLELARELLSYGAYFLIATLGVQLLYQVDKFLVGSMLSVAAVTFYVVPGNVTQKLQQLLGAAAQIIFPVSSALSAKEDRETIARLYADATRLLFLLGASFTVPLVAFARPFLRFWMGPEFAGQSALVMILLTITYFLLGLMSVAWGIAFGSGSARINAGFAVLMGAVDITLFLVLTPRFGIVGSASAYLIAACTGMPPLVWLVERKVIGASGFEFLVQYLRPFVASVLSAIAAILLLRFATNLWSTVLLMGGVAALAPCLYFVLGLAQAQDRRVLSMLIARIRG